MTTITHTVTIDRPVADVWDYTSDARNDPVWQRNVVEVGRGADRPLEPGAEIEETVSFLGRRFPVTFVVTEHTPHRRSAVEVRRAPVRGRGAYEFEAVDGGTRFTMTFEGENAHRLFKLAEPVFARLVRRDLATCCETLKDLLEAGADRNDLRTQAA
jgi:Polyketide cyclase / dehydrase and lipid transport